MNQKNILTKIIKETKETSDKQSEIFTSLLKQYPIESEVSYDETNIRQLIPKIEHYKVYYGELHNKENAKLKSMEDLLEIEEAKKYDYFKFDYDKQLDKYEIEKYYLKKDPDLILIRRAIEIQKIRVYFFKMCVDILKGLNWNIKEFRQNVPLL